MSSKDDYGRDEPFGFTIKEPPPPAPKKDANDDGGDAAPVKVLKRPDRDVERDFAAIPPPPPPPPPPKKDKQLERGFSR